MHFLPAISLNFFSARSFVDDGLVDHLNVSDINGLIDNRRVVNNHSRRPYRFQETTLLDKHESTARYGSLVHFHDPSRSESSRRMQRSPANITVAAMPGNPGGRPLSLRHPIPSKF